MGSSFENEPATKGPEEVALATHNQRILAVFIDFVVLCALGISMLIAVLNFLPALNNPIGGYVWLGIFFVIDLVMTALWGLSLGRFALGIRVIRLDDGRSPGLPRALARIALVLLTGVFAIPSRTGSGRTYLGLPDRFWWDRAAGTLLVRSRSPRSPFGDAPDSLARLKARLQD